MERHNIKRITSKGIAFKIESINLWLERDLSLDVIPEINLGVILQMFFLVPYSRYCNLQLGEKNRSYVNII